MVAEPAGARVLRPAVYPGSRVKESSAGATSSFDCTCSGGKRSGGSRFPLRRRVIEEIARLHPFGRPCVCRLAPVQRIACKMSAEERCGGGCTWVSSWEGGESMGRGWNAIGNGTPFEEGLRREAVHHLSVCRCRSGPGAPSISPLSWMHKIHGLSRAASQSADADQSPRLLHMSAYHTRHIPGPARVPSSCPFGRHDSALRAL